MLSRKKLLGYKDRDCGFEFLKTQLDPNISSRKLRLFAVACARAVECMANHEYSSKAIRIAEAHADGRATDQELSAAWLSQTVAVFDGHDGDAVQEARKLIKFASFPQGNLWETASVISKRIAAILAIELQGYAIPCWEFQIDAILDIAGPRRLPEIGEAVLRWNDSTVCRMAGEIYSEKKFGELPVLGDAIQDAGCTDTMILDYCREPGFHTRGCWVLDLLLDKR